MLCSKWYILIWTSTSSLASHASRLTSIQINSSLLLSFSFHPPPLKCWPCKISFSRIGSVLVGLMSWQALLCSCRLTKQWPFTKGNIWAACMPQRSSFLLVYQVLFLLLWLSLLPSYNESPCFQWSLYPPVQEVSDLSPTALHRSILPAHAISKPWEQLERFSCEIFKLQKPEAEEEGAPPLGLLHCPKCGGQCSTACMAQNPPPPSSFPHDMPSRRGQVKTTWIDTDECSWRVLFSYLSLLSVWRQSSVLCYWFGCAGGNRKRRSPRKCYTCRKLPPGVAGWAKGETPLSGRYQVGALQQCQRRKITVLEKSTSLEWRERRNIMSCLCYTSFLKWTTQNWYCKAIYFSKKLSIHLLS